MARRFRPSTILTGLIPGLEWGSGNGRPSVEGWVEPRVGSEGGPPAADFATRKWAPRLATSKPPPGVDMAHGPGAHRLQHEVDAVRVAAATAVPPAQWRDSSSTKHIQVGDPQHDGASGRSVTGSGPGLLPSPGLYSQTTRQRSLGHPPLEAGTGAIECHCGAASGHWAVRGTSTHDRGRGRPILRQEHRPRDPCRRSTGPYFRARVSALCVAD